MLFSTVFGFATAAPEFAAEQAINPFACLVIKDILQYTLFDGDVAGGIRIVLFGWWICSIFGECRAAFDSIYPKLPRVRWKDPAPYLPFGGVYGYAMSSYPIKEKSGHA